MPRTSTATKLYDSFSPLHFQSYNSFCSHYLQIRLELLRYSSTVERKVFFAQAARVKMMQTVKSEYDHQKELVKPEGQA